jgi:predicted HAD superfamily Cof-like phosphohydrolase
MTFFDDVKEWHQKMNLRFNTTIQYDELDSISISRIRLISEEFAELCKAISEENWKEISDALADLTFVVLGTAVEFNLPFNEIWEEVRKSNLTKLGGYLDNGGKFMKPITYKAPDIDSILRKKFNNEALSIHTKSQSCEACGGGLCEYYEGNL